MIILSGEEGGVSNEASSCQVQARDPYVAETGCLFDHIDKVFYFL